MKFSRLAHLFSSHRRRACSEAFASPWRARLGLAFLSKNPVTLTARNGARVTFSREWGDQEVWDWVFQQKIPFQITPQGEVHLQAPAMECFLRPGTQDFTVFREVVMADIYQVADQPLGYVLDLGANIGMFSAFVARRCQRVVSVEAVAENHVLATRNITCNGGDSADVLHRAVAATSGELLRIYKDPENSGCHSLSRAWIGGEGEEPAFEEVETLSLADLLQRLGSETVDYLKCDVEGAEYAIFLGLPIETLRGVRRIGMELHASFEEPERPRRLVRFFTRCGFTVTTNHPVDLLVSGQKRTLMMFCQRP